MRFKIFGLFALVLVLGLGACAGRTPFGPGQLPPDMTVGGPNCQYEDGGHFKGCVVIQRSLEHVKTEAARPVVVLQNPYSYYPGMVVLPPGPNLGYGYPTTYSSFFYYHR